MQDETTGHKGFKLGLNYTILLVGFHSARGSYIGASGELSVTSLLGCGPCMQNTNTADRMFLPEQSASAVMGRTNSLSI